VKQLLDSRRSRWIAIGVAAAAVIVFPLLAIPYVNFQVALIGVYAVAIMGLNLMTGYAGQLSLGQSVFMGLGAYVAAFGAGQGWPVALVFLAACVIPAAVGFIIALPAARLRGHSFAIVTIALPIIAIPLANRFPKVTGGSVGISVTWLDAPSWSGLAVDQWRYYIVALIAAVFFLLARNLVRGKIGRAFTSVRDDELVATAAGISSYWYRVLAFALSSLFGGGAGFLYLVVVQYVTPQALGFITGLYLLAAMVIGGRASIVGSLVGGAFFVVIPTLVGQVDASQTILIYGIVLLIVLFLLPGGIVTLYPRIQALLRSRRSAHGAGRPTMVARTQGKGSK
jgi:branched-chain amino acid transport system permease protein